ncbi:MAG TPA: nucleoside hydrolase [Vicinamibacteria bacterium]|nr:nucleoside hydrolase [Vicinamibacteria bacterium]
MPRTLPTRSISLILAAFLWAPGAVAAQAPGRSVPVILDTDIGDDIDDTWALALALKSPELDVKLVVTDFGNTEQRAKLVARVLELAGRTDIPIGIGIKENDDPGPQAEWVKGFDLAKYPGQVLKDGVQALIDTVMASPEPMTLIAIGPPPNLKAALEREPRIAGKLRLAGMYGSIHLGYDGKPNPEPEWNVRANPAAARALLAAPWRDAILTPLDTCGRVQLSGERYARVRDSSDALLRGLVEAYGIWCRNRDWCAKDPGFVAAKSSTLFDCVAVYLAVSRDLVKTESTGVRVTDEGMTIPDPVARPLVWATEWRDLAGFEEWLTARLTARTSPR